MAKIALKIDVDSLRAAREAVPQLLALLTRLEAGATFFFSLGPDRPHTPLPLPWSGAHVGKRCADVIRRTRDQGFEVGSMAWDADAWERRIESADAAWTTWQMALATQHFQEILSAAPAAHAAPSWRMNPHAFRRTQSLGFAYASDTRGSKPFLPVVRGEIVCCPQFPTTLPALEGASGERELLELTPDACPDQVFTLRAAREGLRELAAVERLLLAWQSFGHQVVSLRTLVEGTAMERLPLHEVHPEKGAWIQGKVFLESVPTP